MVVDAEKPSGAWLQRPMTFAKFIQNGVRMAVILLMVGVLFWVLNSTIGNGIRDMDFYGVKDSYTFYPNALKSSGYSDYYAGRADSETAFAKQSALDFATKYGSLFKPGTPFERMFDSCKGKFSCTDDRRQRHRQRAHTAVPGRSQGF